MAKTDHAGAKEHFERDSEVTGLAPHADTAGAQSPVPSSSFNDRFSAVIEGMSSDSGSNLQRVIDLFHGVGGRQRQGWNSGTRSDRNENVGALCETVAVRYVFMAQELSQQAEKEFGLAAQPGDSSTSEVSTEATQDLDLLAVWAADKPQHEQH